MRSFKKELSKVKTLSIGIAKIIQDYEDTHDITFDELSELVTNDLEKIKDSFEECEWLFCTHNTD